MGIESTLQLLANIVAVGAAVYAVIAFCLSIKSDINNIKKQYAEMYDRMSKDIRRHEQSIADAHKKIRDMKKGR